jgi:hypothetical protein
VAQFVYAPVKIRQHTVHIEIDFFHVHLQYISTSRRFSPLLSVPIMTDIAPHDKMNVSSSDDGWLAKRLPVY